MPARCSLPARQVAPALLLAFAIGWLPSVARAGVEQQVQAHLQAWARARAQALGVESSRIEARLLPSVRKLPDCPQPWDIELPEPATGERFDRLAIRVHCPGTDAIEGRLVAHVILTAQVVVVRNRIVEGQPLDAAQLQLAEHNLARWPTALRQLEQASGQASSRALRAGQVLLAETLSAGAGVRRGERLLIVAHGAGFQIQVHGLALQDGARGERITVRNLSTGRTTLAQVLGPGRVSLQANAAAPFANGHCSPSSASRCRPAAGSR